MCNADSHWALGREKARTEFCVYKSFCMFPRNTNFFWRKFSYSVLQAEIEYIQNIELEEQISGNTFLGNI